MEGKTIMLEFILLKSRYLAVLAVVVTVLCAIVLYAMTSASAVMAIYQTVTAGDWGATATKTFAVTLLKVVDLFLICIGLQIIAGGVYKLFVNSQLALPPAMNTNSFSELKLSLVTISSLVLLIMFVEMAVAHGSGRELLEYGIAIAVILFAASWGLQNRSARKSEKPTH